MSECKRCKKEIKPEDESMQFCADCIKTNAIVGLLQEMHSEIHDITVRFEQFDTEMKSFKEALQELTRRIESEI